MPGFDHDFARERLIIIAAPNGARRMPADGPGLPTTSAELASCAVHLEEQGVSMLHLHVRDASHRHSLDAALYRDAIAAIRASVGDRLVLQVTTESVGQYTAAEQMQLVRDLRPEAVSLALRELAPDAAAEAEFGAFCDWLRTTSIWPQHIVYSAEELKRFDALRRRGLLADDRPFCLLVVGSYAGRPGDIEELMTMLAAVNSDQFPWAVCCFGPQENAVALRAAASGGHVRLGFENNTVLSDGRAASDNAALIAQFRDDLGDSDRVPATADDIRSQLA